MLKSKRAEPVRKWGHFRLRVPSDVKAWLEIESANNGTSQNAEIIRALVRHRDREEAARSAERAAIAAHAVAQVQSA
jgi:hypothetical protein